MCGIVGMATTEVQVWNDDHIAFFEQALHADTIRGEDSTGVFGWNESMREPDYFKRAFAAPDFLQLKGTRKIVRSTKDWNILVGHNRAATRGSIDHSTAHPFQIGDITLVHNGTLDTQSNLPNSHHFTVDSENICYAFSVEKAEDIIPELRGAFTLVWFDALDKSLNIVRNDKRPFSIATVENNESILFASEGMMLKWIATRNKFKIKQMFTPAPGVWLKYFPHSDFKDWQEKPEIKTLELYTPPLAQTWPNYDSGYGTTHDKWGQPLGNNVTAIKQNPAVPTISDKSKEAFAATNTAHGQRVEILDPQWRPYSSNENKGIVFGTDDMISAPHEAVIHAVSKETYENQIKGYHIDGELNSGYISVDGVNTLCLHPSKWSTFYYTDEVSSNTDVPDIPAVAGTTTQEDADGKSVDYFPGPYNSVITEAQFNELNKHGCARCSSDIYLDEIDKVIWTANGDPICPDCVDEYKEAFSG